METVTIRVAEGLSYAEALRRMKNEVNLQNASVVVDRIRRTKAGDLLVRLGKGVGQAERLGSALAPVLGQQANVRVVTTTCTLKIRDLDEITEAEEITETLAKNVDKTTPSDFTVRAIRQSYSGTRLAVVTTPAQYADTLVRMGRIRIGWVTCRVREKAEVIKCYMCMGFGH